MTIGHRCTLRVCVLAATSVMLSACVTPDPPQYASTPATSSPDTGVAPRTTGRVGLVVNGNTDKSISSLQTGIQQGKQFIMPNERMIQDLDPVYMNARLLAALKRAYPNITLEPSVRGSLASGNAVTVVADVQTRLGKVSGQTTYADINLAFTGAGGRQLAKISGHGTGVLPYPAWDYRLQQAADQALDQIAAKL